MTKLAFFENQSEKKYSSNKIIFVQAHWRNLHNRDTFFRSTRMKWPSPFRLSSVVCCRRTVFGPSRRRGKGLSAVQLYDNNTVIMTITILCRDLTPETTTGVAYRCFVLNLTLNFTNSAVLGIRQPNEFTCVNTSSVLFSRSLREPNKTRVCVFKIFFFTLHPRTIGAALTVRFHRGRDPRQTIRFVPCSVRSNVYYFFFPISAVGARILQRQQTRKHAL